MDRADQQLASSDCQLPASAVEQAFSRIRAAVRETPLEDISALFPTSSAKVLCKMENLQETGSFKLRGATNKILSLSTVQAQAGVVAASNGNHGMGVAAAAQRAGIAAEVFVSEHVSAGKAQRIEQLGATIRRIGQNPLEAELAARAAAQQSGRVFISPYNDIDVMAGQGTIAVELLQQAGRLDAVFVAVGGGGLIGGIGTHLKSASPNIEIVGCWPAILRCFMNQSKLDELSTFQKNRRSQKAPLAASSRIQ